LKPEERMNDPDAQRIIGLLEEIRNGQRLQLERQAEALERQAEALLRQREARAGLSQAALDARGIGERAGSLLVQSSKLVNRARLLFWLALPCALLLLAFVLWALFARALP
jgi:hypothetical protein